MTLRPDLCLVKLAPPTVASRGGIILAPALDTAVCYGKVVQVGADVLDVAIGDVVAFSPTAGEPVGEPLFVLPHVLISEDAIDVRMLHE